MCILLDFYWLIIFLKILVINLRVLFCRVYWLVIVLFVWWIFFFWCMVCMVLIFDEWRMFIIVLFSIEVEGFYVLIMLVFLNELLIYEYIFKWLNKIIFYFWKSGVMGVWVFYIWIFCFWFLFFVSGFFFLVFSILLYKVGKILCNVVLKFFFIYFWFLLCWEFYF